MNPLQSNVLARHQALSGLDECLETDAPQTVVSEQYQHKDLPAAIKVGPYTFHAGRVMTALSEYEAKLLHAVLHCDVPKELHSKSVNKDDGFFTYVVGAKDYFASLHFPRDLNLPEQMIVKCALNSSFALLRVIVTDIKGKHIFCDASLNPPVAA